jgi:hypothetical protein
MRTRCILLLGVLSLALWGCGGAMAGTALPAELPPSDPQAIPSENVTEAPLQFNQTPEPSAMPSTPPVEKFVALSKADLAVRLHVEPERIAVVKTAEMTWPNAALGCPRPGKVYATGRVPGFQIWLEVEGMEYIYNTDFNGTVVLCPELNPGLPNATSGPTSIGPPIK